MLSVLFLTLVADPPPVNAAPPPALTADQHKDAVTRFGVAVWNIRRERLLSAVRQLEAVAEQEPDATAPLRELVRLYAQLGREPDAIRVARQVLAKAPDDVEVAHTLARLLLEAGESKDAVAVAKLAVATPMPTKRADKAVAIYRDLASLCEKAGDLATAEAALRTAITYLTAKRQEVIAAGAFTPPEADTTAAECYERLGRVQARLREFAAAAESFTAAARLYADPKVNDAASASRLNWNLSGVLLEQGEPRAALEKLEAFLTLKPSAPDPYARYATLLRMVGREGEVVPLLRRLMERDAGNTSLKAVLAAELVRAPSTRREGDELFRKLLATTNDPRVLEVYLRTQLENRRPGEIIALLDQVFTTLKEKENGEKKPPTPELIAAREFAAARAEVLADLLRADSDAATAVLRAAADDVRAGVKRTHQVHFFLGQLAARHRQLGLAAAQFQHAVRSAPRETQGDAYSALIDVLLMAGKPADIRDACRDGLRHALDISPHYFNYYLAGALAELGDGRGALEAADAAILQTADGDRLAVRLQKVRVLKTLGKWSEAIELARKLLDEFEAPGDRAAIRYTLAGAYWGAKKYTEAEAEYRAVLDLDPDHIGANNDLGYHLAELGRDLSEAERLIRHAITLDRYKRRKAGDAEPENASYIDSLGWVLFRQGKLLEARAELERALTITAGSPDPVLWDHLGDVLFRLGEKDKAKAAWEQARDLYESEPPGAALRHEGRAAEVRVKLKRIP